MVVQHNLTAMNSNRMLGLTTAAQAKSTEKLSSGYKINRAADDAAGLAISEKMRKQIRGLTQASANAQDGISAVQTAEGALTEVHDMLQRMNELAVKAANGTNSESDREAIQSEIDQLVTEIDRVAETTKFNETYLLKGDKDVAKSYSYSYGAVGSTTAAGAVMDTDAATGLTVDITFTEGASASDQNTIAMALRDQGVTVSYEEATDEDGNTTQKYSVTLNGAAASNYNVNAMSDSTFEIVDLEGNQIATLTASGGGAPAAVEGGEETPPAEGTMTLGADALYVEDPDNAGAYIAITEDELGTYFDVNADDGTVTVKDPTTVFYSDNTGTTVTIDDTNIGSYVVGSPAETTETTETTAAAANVAAKAGSQLYDAVGNTIDMTKAAQSVAANQNRVGALNLRLHVGADATSNNQISLNIEAMSAKGLGINGLKVDGTDDSSALSAIETIKEAIQKVSSQRSDLGAVQNRLEHTINNLDNVVENTTSAESQIRDTDMATEMVSYSNNNILAQAGQAMLAQANQSNQGVLSLLG